MAKYPMINETGCGAYGLEKYQMIEEVELGIFDVVWKAYDKYTGEAVAIKKLGVVGGCMNLKECTSLDMMIRHPNIMKRKEVVEENNFEYMIFEYIEFSLRKFMLELIEPLSEPAIRDLCFQVFQGLEDMHNKNYVHGDVKPSNLLVSGELIKLGNGGHVCDEIHGEPRSTGYVTSLWYQAPEMLLCSPMCDYAVDMWAMGAIMVELFTNQPLFQGSSSADVLNRICEVLGSPTERTWLAGLDLSKKHNYKFPRQFGWRISKLVPYASSEAIHLIDSLLSWDPNMRPSAMEALQHPFFDSCYVDLPFDSERVKTSNKDLIRMLPEYHYDYEMEKETSMENCTVDTKREETSMRNCTVESQRANDSNKDTISFLPENGFVINEETSVKSCSVDSEKADDSKEDQIDHVLPKYKNKTEINKEPESILTNRLLEGDWLDAAFSFLWNTKLNILICLIILLVSYATNTEY